MATVDNAWYYSFGDGSTTGYFAVTKWATGNTQHCGDIIRQNAAPSVGNERTFVCIASTSGTGTTGGAEPTWTVTRGAKNTDNTVTWQEATGIAALNGDKTNQPAWSVVKNTSVSLGQVIKSGDNTKILICTTAGTAGNGSEPTWAAFTNAGATTADNTVTWTTLKDSGNNFGNWASPQARLQNVAANTWLVAGNTVYVASNSAETTSAGTTIAFGTNALVTPTLIICVNQAGNVPPQGSDVTTGASYTLTAAVSLSVQASIYVQGMSFVGPPAASAGNITAAGSASAMFYYKNCSFNMRGTGNIAMNSSNGVLVFDNTTVQFGNSGANINQLSITSFIWRNTPSALQGATIPTNLIVPSPSALPSFYELEGVDLSAYTGSALFLSTGASSSFFATLKDCKLNSNTGNFSVQTTSPLQKFDLIRCATGANNYRSYRQRHNGTQDTETTIVRTGGATDGTQAQSWKIVTSAACAPLLPFNAQPIRIWNNFNSGSHTVTLFGIWGGGAVPTNANIWFDLEYYGSSSDPDDTLATCGQATPLTTASNLSTDSSTWGGSTTAFSMAITFSPLQKGYIYLYVKAGLASTTFYVDPLPVLV